MGDATEGGGLTERLECQVPSCYHRQRTFDLIAKLRARRLKWAGQILRLEPKDSLVHQVLVAAAMHDLAEGALGNSRRSLLMDA